MHRGKSAKYVNKKWKPQAKADYLGHAGKLANLRYSKAEKARLQVNESDPERDIVDVINEVARPVERILEMMKELYEEFWDLSVTVQPRWRGTGTLAVFFSRLFALVFVLGLVTSTAAELDLRVRLRAIYGREPEPKPERERGTDAEREAAATGFGLSDVIDWLSQLSKRFSAPHRDKRSASGGKRFTQEELESIRRRNNLTVANRNSNNNPVGNIENNPIGDLNNVNPYDPNGAHRRRLGDGEHSIYENNGGLTENHDRERSFPQVQDQSIMDSFNDIHQYNQTSTFSREAFNFMPTRTLLGELILEENGLDPNQMIQVYTTWATGAKTIQQGAGSRQIETKRFIDAYLENQISTIPFAWRNGPSTLENLPDLDHIFNVNFDAHVESTKHLGTQEITKKLSALGVNGSKNATLLCPIFYTNEHATLTPVGAARHHHEGHLGYIIRVKGERESQDFAILPHHPEMVIRIPKHPNAHHHWLARWIETRRNLFFKFNTDYSRVTRYTATILDENIKVSDATEKIVNLIFDHTFSSLKKLAYQATELNDFLETMRGLFMPGYDLGAALRDKDYASSVMYFGLDVIPNVLPVKTIVVRLATKVKTRINKLRGITKLVNTGEDLGSQARNVVKDTKRLRAGGDLDVESIGSNSETGSLARQQNIPETGSQAGQPPANTGSRRVDPDALENLREIPGRPARLSAGGQGKLQAFKDLIGRDSRAQQFMSNSNLSVESKIGYITDLLERNGYETQVRGILVWRSLKVDLEGNLPLQHFIVLAKKADDGAHQFAVDVMASKFDKILGLSGSIVDIEDQWFRLFNNGRRSYLPDGVIKYRDFANFHDAKSTLEAWNTAMPVSDLGRDITILGAPRKYTDSLKYATENGIRNVSRRRKFGRYIVEGAKEIAPIALDEGRLANGIRGGAAAAAARGVAQNARRGGRLGANMKEALERNTTST